MDRWVSGCHASLGVGETLCGIDPPLSTGLGGVVSMIHLGGVKRFCKKQSIESITPNY